MDLYEVCSYDAPGVKTSPAPGVKSRNIGTETGRRRDLIFVCDISLETSTKFVYKMPLGSELALPWGSQVEHRNKERKFYNSSSLKLDGLEL